jgi:hypothetical protein
MPAAARQFFTIDLRGLRAALSARAASLGLSESDVLRGALAAALVSSTDTKDSDIAASSSCDNTPSRTNQQIKLSTRLPRLAATRLDYNARAAGLSRGAYLTRLIEGAPTVATSADRKAGFAALSASSAELALLSRDIHHLTVLLKAGDIDAARPYRALLDTLDGSVRAHLAKATCTLTDLSVEAKAARPRQPSQRASAVLAPTPQQRTTP